MPTASLNGRRAGRGLWYSAEFPVFLSVETYPEEPIDGPLGGIGFRWQGEATALKIYVYILSPARLHKHHGGSCGETL